MRIFTISDLHLSFGSNKPMDVFRGWENHTEKIAENWKKSVSEKDIVVLGGDTSWALKIEEAREDFAFIDALPGKKLLMKGNHDFWWSTASKINNFFAENDFKSISLLHNNCFSNGEVSVCGTRGWLYDGTGPKDEKVILRECGRLEQSLRLGTEAGGEPIVFLHYPPVYGDFKCDEIFDVIKRYGVKRVYYGHIHGNGKNYTVPEYDGVKMSLVSCDCVNFTPVLVGQYRDFA